MFTTVYTLRLTTLATLTCALTFALGGCSSTPKSSPRVLSKDLRGTEGQETISVAKGQTLAVRLRTDAAAGYKWRMPPGAEDNDLLTLAEHHTEQDGATTWDIFTFRTRGTGSTSMQFFCDRPMETEPLPSDKRFTLNVQVTKPGDSTAQASVPTD